jgi:transposase
MKAYSMDLRKRVLADSDAGLATKPVAEKYGVSRTWVRSLKQRRRETGEIAPRVGGGRKPKIDRARLAALVQQQPDATLVELRERLGLQCSLSAIWMALDALRITFKKKRSALPNKTGPTSRRNGRTGRPVKSGSTRGGLSSSMKRGPTRK